MSQATNTESADVPQTRASSSEVARSELDVAGQSGVQDRTSVKGNKSNPNRSTDVTTGRDTKRCQQQPPRPDGPENASPEIPIIDLDDEVQPKEQHEANLSIGRIVAEQDGSIVYDSQLMTLLPDRWIDSSVLDTYNQLQLSNAAAVRDVSNLKYISGLFYRFTSRRSKCNPFRFFPKDYATGDTLIFPSVHNGHFWLNVIKTNEDHDILVFDTMPDRSKAQYMLGLIGRLEEVIPGTRGMWGWRHAPCPKQKDKNSCGVFVMAIAKEVINGREEGILNLQISTADFRKDVALQLLNTTTIGQEMLRSCDGNADRVLQKLQNEKLWGTSL